MWLNFGIGLTFLSLSVTNVWAQQKPPAKYWEESGDDGSFTHANQRKWPDVNCAKRDQSPIAIEFASQSSEISSPPIRFVDYDRANQKLQVVLENDKGTINTVRLWSQDSMTPYVSGGVIYNGERFYFEQAIFHWGSPGNLGSEHKVYGTQYSMEVQFVHYPSYHNTVKEALEKQSPVLIVCAFLQEYSAFYVNPNLEPVFKAVSQLSNDKKQNDIFGFKLGSLLPARPSYYFRYDGRSSLPTCQGPVEWLVLRSPIYIGTQQLQAFLRLTDSSGKRIEDNYRQTQDTSGRRVSVGLAY